MRWIQATPTASTPTTGRIGRFLWLREALSDKDGMLSTKRHIVAASAICLCLVFLWIGWSSARRIRWFGELGTGAVAALTFVGGILAGLAGSAYRKPDALSGAPAASDSTGSKSNPSDLSDAGSAKANVVFASDPNRGQA